MNPKLESKFQGDLIKELRKEYPDAIILKNDPNYMQGIPDLVVLWEDRWAALECKQSIESMLQPNQAYYVLKMDDMSFATVIAPENKEEVLDALQSAFRAAR